MIPGQSQVVCRITRAIRSAPPRALEIRALCTNGVPPSWGERHSRALPCYRKCQDIPGSVAEHCSITICVPFAVESAGSARHRPEFGLISPPAISRVVVIFHCWPLSPDRHDHSWILVPLAVPPPVTSRHLPSTRTVPPGSTVQFWAAPPLQA